MFKKRRRKKKWGQRLGYGCMTLVAVGIIALFTFGSLVKQRSMQLHEEVGEPAFLKHQAERLAENANPQTESQNTDTGVSLIPTSDQAEKAQTAVDAFAVNWDKVRSSLSRDAWRIEQLITDINRIGNDEATLKDLYSLLSEHPDLVELSKAVASSGVPPCLELDPELGLASQNFRSGWRIGICGGILAIDARMKAESGDPAGAGESLLDALRLADTYSVLPHDVGYRVRFNSQKSVLNVLASVDTGTSATPEQMQEIIERLGAGHYRQEAIDHLEYQVYSDIEIVEDMTSLSKEEFLALHAPGDEDEIAAHIALGVMGSPIVTPFLLNSANDMLDVWSQIRQVADLPYMEASPALEEMMDEFGNHGFAGPIVHPVRNLYYGFQRQCRHESEIEQTRLNLAIELYYAEHNEYPEELSELTNLLGGELPLDAWTGEPFNYKVEGESFILQRPDH